MQSKPLKCMSCMMKITYKQTVNKQKEIEPPQMMIYVPSFSGTIFILYFYIARVQQISYSPCIVCIRHRPLNCLIIELCLQTAYAVTIYQHSFLLNIITSKTQIVSNSSLLTLLLGFLGFTTKICLTDQSTQQGYYNWEQSIK